jgi:hypothetical protein
MASHQAELDCLADDRRDPHVIVSAGTPIPKKDKVDSIRMAVAIPKAIAISTGESALGIACLKIVRTSL